MMDCESMLAQLHDRDQHNRASSDRFKPYLKRTPSLIHRFALLVDGTAYEK